MRNVCIGVQEIAHQDNTPACSATRVFHIILAFTFFAIVNH